MNKLSKVYISPATRLILMIGGGFGGACLLPSVALPESRVASAPAGTALAATARVGFKIVIPKMLYVRVGAEAGNAPDGGVVSVIGNNHHAPMETASRTDSIAPAGGGIPRRRIYTVSLP